MDSKLLGHWKLARSENVDEYMKASNVNFMLRKLAQTLSYQLEFVNEPDGSCKINTTSTFKNMSTAFRPGEEFDEVDMSGKKYKCVLFIEEGGVLHGKRFPVDKKDPTFDNRLFVNDDDELVNTSTIVSVEPHITSTRILKRV